MKNRIETLRKERGYTQQALGEALGVSRQTIISLENGKYNPSLGLAHLIAKLFDLSIEEVFIFEEDEK
ncbi:MAG: helix-turn-helix transcriptional regulator [Lachnospiraceae bacterium]